MVIARANLPEVFSLFIGVGQVVWATMTTGIDTHAHSMFTRRAGNERTNIRHGI